MSSRTLALAGATIRAAPNRRIQLALAEFAARVLRPQGHVVARVQPGFRLHLDLRDRFQAQTYLLRAYEPATTRLVGNLLRPGDTFFDGGANIGYFTLLGAVRVGSAGSVHAFEPVARTFANLQANVALNGLANVHLNQMALADADAPLILEIPLDRRTGAAAFWGATVVRLQRGASVAVSAGTLDEYAARANIDTIKLVKLDLEGGEAAAIRGMQQLLAAHAIRYLLCECNQFLLAAAGLTFGAIRQSFAEHGYRCFRINRTGIPHLKEQSIHLADPAVTDYLFAAPGLQPV